MTHFVQIWYEWETYIALERNIGGGLRFTLAPAKYENVTKGQERDRYIEMRIGPHCGKAKLHLKGIYIQSIQAFKATTWSVTVTPWLLGSCNSMPIHSYIGAG